MELSGYPEYMQRTSGFVPLPPEKSPSGLAAKQADPADVSILKRSTKETPWPRQGPSTRPLSA